MDSQDLPFTGLRVVDFTHILAGPLCTQFLADAGATVLKIEPPRGEYSRIRGPMRAGTDGTQLSGYSAAVNRGKGSIALDLKNPAGLRLAKSLIDTADIVVENFSPGALARLGIDLGRERARRPELITCSITLYGDSAGDSSLARRGGLAIVAEGESSVTGMTRDESGRPIASGVPFGDMATGMGAYAAIATALYHQARTGRGRHLDISMVGTLWALNARDVTAVQIANVDRYIMPSPGYGIFPAADGYVTLGLTTDDLFRRAMSVMGMAEFASDSQYGTYQERDLHAREVNALISNWTRARTVLEYLETLSQTGIPCGRITSPRDVLSDPVLRERGYIETIGDGVGGAIDVPANPFGFRLPPGCGIPRLGDATADALSAIGIDAQELEKLRSAGAFGAPVGSDSR